MDQTDHKALVQRIEDRLAELGLNARKASLSVGDNPELIRNVTRFGEDANPKTETLAKIAQALKWSVAKLVTGRDDVEILGRDSEVVMLDTPPPPLPDRANMLEIRGTAMGSVIQEGIEGFHFDGSPIGFVRRPVSLLSVKEAYALLVTGDSMAPMHNPGETRIVNPRRPTAPGDTVIAITKHWEDDPGQAYIKILRRRTQSSVILQQLNPEMVIEIPARYLAGLHYVLTYDDILGS